MRIVERYEGDAPGEGGGGGEWLSTQGGDSDIVISSRVRLARNLRDRPFAAKLTPDDREAVEAELRAALADVDFGSEMTYVDLEKAPRLDAEVLVERHLVSREIARGEGPRGACYSRRRDDLRDGLRGGPPAAAGPAQRARARRRVDRGRRARRPHRAARRLRVLQHVHGYLTCCPTNVGTGLRASVMLHLPALVYSKHIEKVFQAGAKMNLAVRGLYGEGTQALGDFYQISNQTALGKSEDDLLERLSRVVPQFIEYERQLRQGLLTGDRERLEDRVWRAYATLRAARAIASDEALEHLSAVRLGVNLGLLPDSLTMRTVNELFILSQPAHLQRWGTGPLEPRERDVARATLLRERLGDVE